MRGLWTVVALLAPLVGHAADGSAVKVKPGADLKSFFSGTFPYDHVLMPDDPTGSGVLDVRAKLGIDAGDPFRLEFHHAVTGRAPGEASGMGAGLGVGQEAPEAIDLSWSAVDADQMQLFGRTDRMVIRSSMGPVGIALGRQSISFGAGQFFTPIDLVNPFHPATVDTEYKPGVDAFRVDAFPSASSQVSAVVAYGGEWDVDGMVMALHGQATVGTSDLGLFIGEVFGDEVVGLSGVFSAGPVGLYSDAALTLPSDDEDDPYVRAVLGANHRPTMTTTVSVESYYQGAGTTDPDDYLEQMSGDRYARGELWAVGQWYAGLSLAQEITPMILGNAGAVVNLADGSLLVLPSVVVSAAEDVEVVVGAFVGLGKRPRDVQVMDMFMGDFGIESEFGMYPSTVYAQTKVYF